MGHGSLRPPSRPDHPRTTTGTRTTPRRPPRSETGNASCCRKQHLPAGATPPPSPTRAAPFPLVRVPRENSLSTVPMTSKSRPSASWERDPGRPYLPFLFSSAMEL